MNWCESFLEKFDQPIDVRLIVKGLTFTALGVNEYEDQISIQAEIEMTSVTDYTGSSFTVRPYFFKNCLDTIYSEKP